MDIDARYELLEKIGAGSFATVYRARDLELGREVAVKQIHVQYLDDPKQLSRYWQEAQLLASLQHPNIVTIFDLYRERGWLILELMQGNLAERLEGRQMDLRALRATLAHSLRALKYLHSRGVIHGDIKPSNMMIDARRRVKLGDFGLARRVSDEEGSLLKGTTKYMAPETVSDEFGPVGPASDLYSLGFAAYELMCGPNFESLFPGLSAFGRNKQVAWMMWHAAPDRRLPEIGRVLQGVPDDLANVIQRLCEKDPAKRYQNADDALSDLNIDLKVVKKGEPEIEPAESQAVDPARKKRLMMAGGGFAASLVLCLVLLLMPGVSQPDTQTVRVGVVRLVDVDERMLKLQDLAGTRAWNLRVPPNPRISLEEGGALTNVTLDELNPADRVEYEFQEERGGTVIVIRAARPVLTRGRVVDLDLQDATLRIALEDGSREELDLRIPDKTDVFRNLSRAALARTGDNFERERLKRRHRIAPGEMRRGDRIEVAHLPELAARSGRTVSGPLFVQRYSRSVAWIAAVDAAQSRPSVTLGDENGAPGLSPLPIAEDCQIALRGSDGTQTAALRPGDLRKGDLVEVAFDTSLHEIVVSRGEAVKGAIDAVPADGGPLVVSLSNEPARVAFEITDQTRIWLGPNAAGIHEYEPVSSSELRTSDRAVIVARELTDGTRVAETLVATRGLRADRWAVIVGVRSFDDKSLARLPYSSADADLVATALRNRYAFKNERLVRLIDPTRDQIEGELERVLQNATSDAQVLVYVSTHAFVADGRVYLAGRKFDSDRIAETGLPLERIVELLENCRSQDKILLFDGSHEWSGRQRAAQPSSAEMLRLLETPLDSTVAIAGCAEGERGATLEADGERRGVFAHHVALGLGGRADADRNLHVTADELFAFLRTNMAETVLDGGKSQTPGRFPQK